MPPIEDDFDSLTKCARYRLRVGPREDGAGWRYVAVFGWLAIRAVPGNLLAAAAGYSGTAVLWPASGCADSTVLGMMTSAKAAAARVTLAAAAAAPVS